MLISFLGLVFFYGILIEKINFQQISQRERSLVVGVGVMIA